MYIYGIPDETGKVLVQCEICSTQRKIFLKNAILSMNNKNSHTCQSCAAKKRNREQITICSKEYWTQEKKNKLRESLNNSQHVKEGYKKTALKITGSGNGMFGKKHTSEAKQKMTAKRTGKKQSKETVEKRIKTLKQNLITNPKPKKALSYELKLYVNGHNNWRYKILERDNFKCVKCDATKCKLDVHHIEPLSLLIKRLLLESNMNFKDNEDKFQYLILQPKIIDNELMNGMTVCRNCHRKIHNNWGSHNIETT